MHPVRVILSGPFCTGKTTLLRKLREDPELRIETLFADATRAMRPNEREGDPYYFISNEEYERRRAAGIYFSTVHFGGNFYATKHTDADKARWAIDIVAANLPYFKSKQGLVTIYMKPPNVETLIARAKQRGENDAAIQKRLLATNIDDPSAKDFMYEIDASEPLDQVYNKVKQIVLKHMAQP